MQWLIWSHGHSFDGVEVSALVLPAVHIGFHGHTLAGGEIVKYRHLVAGELYEYKVGITFAVFLPRVIEDEFSFLEIFRHLHHRRNEVNEGGCC